MMIIQNLFLFCHLVLKKKQILTPIKGRNSMRKQRFTILMLILSMIMCLQNLVSIYLFVLKILSKNQILTSIKGHNYVANLRKTMIYITNVDLVNDYVYTKFGLNRSICFQDIEHTVYPVTPNAGMFYQRGCKHLRRGNMQGKKTCNLRISIVPISNITFQTLCKRAFL